MTTFISQIFTNISDVSEIKLRKMKNKTELSLSKICYCCYVNVHTSVGVIPDFSKNISISLTMFLDAQFISPSRQIDVAADIYGKYKR